MIVKISSVRLGHANNSSSSHSILLGSKMPENLDVRSFEYGWEWFHLVNPKDKARYMAAMVFMALPKNIAYQHKASIIKDILGVDMASEYFKAKNHLGETPLPHADHQSAFSFPHSLLNREQFHAEFLQELCDHVVHNPRISIRGGNDNEEIPEAWQKDCGTPALKNIKTDSDEILFARKEGDWWILYNHRTGAKIRFSFKDDAKPLTHASTPELVDLKITDYCDKGCPFCLGPDTLVLRADLTWSKIEDLKEGDGLVGFDENPKEHDRSRKIKPAVVQKVWKTRKKAVRITTDKGSVVASMDHPWLSSSTGRWTNTGFLRIGNSIRFAAQPWKISKKNVDYKRGYIKGVMDGDGSIRENPLPGATGKPDDPRRQVWWELRVTDSEIAERVALYLSDLGSKLEVTVSHSKKGYKDLFRVGSHKKKLVKQLCHVTDGKESNDYVLGYLAGIFDAEGSASGVIRIAQMKDNGLLDRVESYLAGFGFDFSRDAKSTRLKGGFWEGMRFFGIVDPACQRKVDSWWKKNSAGYSDSATIVCLEYLGEMDLVDIQTSTRTFYANGLASHNCYQASGENGKHAAVDDISHIVYGLREAQTFEIALGGGEPTAHPAFCQILEAIYHNGITPNFSSNSTDWMKDKKISKAVKEFCGSFAISNLKKIRDVLDWNTKGVTHSGVYSDQALPQATLQIPLGCYDEKTVKDTLRVAEEFSWDIPITLLGFKRFGRGTSFKPFSYSWILDFIQEIDLERFGADSVFIQEFGEDLKKRGISPTLFVDGEGAFSCYIDAVKREIGASSYSGDMKPLVRPGDNYVDMKEGLSHFPFSKVNVS
jgi:hypothetical protein